MRRYSPQEAFRIIEAASPKALPDEAGLRRIAGEFGIPPEADLPGARAAEQGPAIDLDIWGRGASPDPEFASPLPAIGALHRIAQRTGLPLTSDGRVSGRWQGARLQMEAVEEPSGSSVILRLPRQKQWKSRLACLALPLLCSTLWLPAFAPLSWVIGRDWAPALAWAAVSGGLWWAVGRLEARRFSRAAAGVRSILQSASPARLEAAPFGAK